MRVVVRATALVASVVVAVSGCSGDTDDPSDPSESETATSPTEATTTPTGDEDAVTLPTPAQRSPGFSPCELLSESDVVEFPNIDEGDVFFARQLPRYGSDGVDACRIGSRSTLACAGCDFAAVEVGIYTGRPTRTFDQLTSQMQSPTRPQVGDRAMLADSGPHRYSMWVDSGDALVFVLAQETGSEPLRPNHVVELARRAVSNLPDGAVKKVDRDEILPTVCDKLDRAAIKEVLSGPVVLARGSVTDASVTCDYQADSPVARNRNSPEPKQLGLQVQFTEVDDGREYVDELIAGEYGAAEELSGLGERAVYDSEEHEIEVQLSDRINLTVEAFLAYGPDREPREALIHVAESALTMVSA